MIVNDTRTAISEAFRSLRTNIQFSNIDSELKSLVITSSVPCEGKSTVALNLAISMAQTEKKVLLIDGDLRKPSIHTYFDVRFPFGLTHIITQKTNYKYALQYPYEGLNLHIITSGPIPPNPSELLGSTSMKNLLNALENEYDLVILDSPPIGLVTDAAVLSALADGIIIVYHAGKTKKEILLKSVNALKKVNSNILGIVMNMVQSEHNMYDKSYYYNSENEHQV